MHKHLTWLPRHLSVCKHLICLNCLADTPDHGGCPNCLEGSL